MIQHFSKIFLLFFILKVAICDSCDEKHLGECPEIDDFPNFDMDKMLGTWYAIEKTCTTSQCIVYNISQTNAIGEYKIEQISEHYVLDWTPIKSNSYSAATLKIIDPQHPGTMEITYPFKFFGQETLTVFLTDYDNFAGIFECKKGLSSGHKQSATILSRGRSLDKIYVEKVRNMMSKNEINPFDLAIVKQESCTNSIRDSWASYKADIIRKTGNAVSNGVDCVSNVGRALFNKVADTVENTVEKGRGLTQNVYENVEQKVRNSGNNVRKFYRNGQEILLESNGDKFGNVATNALDNTASAVAGSIEKQLEIGKNLKDDNFNFQDTLREAEENARRNYGNVDRKLGETVGNV